MWRGCGLRPADSPVPPQTPFFPTVAVSLGGGGVQGLLVSEGSTGAAVVTVLLGLSVPSTLPFAPPDLGHLGWDPWGPGQDGVLCRDPDATVGCWDQLC